MTVRVVIADDHAMVRAGLRSLLSRDPEIEVVSEADDGDTAITMVRRYLPDVVLMDIRMPVVDGLTATRRLLADDGLDSRVLILTTFDLDQYVFEALEAGASGFLLKDATPEQLTAAVKTLADGNALLDPTATRRVINAFVGMRPTPAQTDRLVGLTDREMQVLRRVAMGLTNAEIARDLTVSSATVKTHVSNLLGKLGLRDRVHAVILAYQAGIMGPERM